MLTLMHSAGALLASARQEAGLSVRDLAARAKVAYSTVTRIEQGRMDPTIGMLTRLLQAAGRGLEVSTPESEAPQLADLVDAWHTDRSGQDRPDWTRLRAFLDALALRPELAGPATLRMPAPSGSEFMDNLLAGMAEKVSDDLGLPRPAWARKIHPLECPWVSPGTPRMQAEATTATPEQLSSRGITMRAESLWRNPQAVGL